MTHQSSIMSGVLRLQAFAHTLGALLQLSSPISVWLLVSFCSRLESEPRAWRKCFSHTHLSLQRDSSAASRVRRGRLGNKAGNVCACDRGWMACMYLQGVQEVSRNGVHVCVKREEGE